MRSAPSWAEIPASFEDPLIEYSALVEGCAQLDRVSGSVDVTGGDAAEFLHGQLSADVKGLEVGRAVEALSLSPRGKLQGVGYLLRPDETRFRFLVDRTQVDVVAEALLRFRIRVDVSVTPRPDVNVWSVVGPGAEANALVVDSGVGSDPLSFEEVDGDLVVRARAGGLGGFHVVSTVEELAVPGAVPAGRAAVDVRRVELGLAQFGVDYDTSTIPHEAGLVPRAVSLDKGCYTGQELVERLHSRGHPNRRPARVRLDTDEVPEAGAEVLWGDRAVGTLTTTAWSPEWSSAGGLGLLRVEAEHGSDVVVAGAPSEILR